MAALPPKKAPKKPTDRRDTNGHPMSSWDMHVACRSCLRGMGQFCTRAAPCTVCAKWTDAMWRASEDAERRSALKRAQRRRKREQRAGQASPVLMPPPKEIPRRVVKTSSTRRRDRSMGEDADWMPEESFAPPGPADSGTRNTLPGRFAQGH